MSTDERLEEAHRRVKAFAQELEDEDFQPTEVIDALMGVGANAYNRLCGPQALAQTMRRFADEIEAGGPG